MTEAKNGDSVKNTVERIERETSVRVPSFISRWPAIEETKAADLAKKRDLVCEEEDDLWRASRVGLSFCRDRDIGVEAAYKIGAVETPDLSALDLFDMFLAPTWDLRNLEVSERQRRSIRDMEILHLETDLLRRRGITVPALSSLLEYCEWIPEVRGKNEKLRVQGWKPYDSFMIYWILMEHYSQIIRKAKMAFDPLADFELYLKGDKKLTGADGWSLQNIGDEDISYYAMVSKWGIRPRTWSVAEFSNKRLATHTTSLRAARSIIGSSFLYPRICFSSGRVLSFREYPEVTFIFDVNELEQLYSVRRYSELGGGHEKELRCNEQVNVRFAIACVPMTRSLFYDNQGYGEGTIAWGEKTMERWEENYLRTGKLWDDAEAENIRNIAGNHV